MHGPGATLQRGPKRATGQRANPAQALGRGVMHADLEEPLGRASEQLQLVDRLPRAGVAQLRGPIGGEQQQRHARLLRLDRGRQQLRRGRAGGARHRHGHARRLGEAEREETGAALVHVGEAAQPRLGGKREHQRGAARPGRGARRAHAAARQLVDERPQQHKRVRGGAHETTMARCRRRSSCCTGSAARTARGTAWRSGSRLNATCRSRSTCPDMARPRRPSARSRSPAVSSTCSRERPRASSWAATRSAAASPCTSRSRPRSGWRGSC